MNLFRWFKIGIFPSLLVFLSVLWSANALADAKISPKLNVAIEAWLDDNDAEAIPLLAQLANSGDEDAMIMLGQLAKRPGQFSAFMSSLDRKERNRLLKAKGGFSGVSWLSKVKSKRNLAVALKSVDNPPARVAGIMALIRLGEHGQALRSILKYGWGQSLISISLTHKVPTEASYLLWAAAIHSPTKGNSRLVKLQAKKLVNDGKSSLGAEGLQGFMFYFFTYGLNSNTPVSGRLLRNIGLILYSGEMDTSGPSNFANYGDYKQPLMTKATLSKLHTKAMDIIMASEETRPVVDFCQKYCMATVRGCSRTVYGAIGGYSNLAAIQSPVERLIERKRYFQSKRYPVDIIRAADLSRLTSWKKGHPTRVDACAYKLIIDSY